jgi:hypothetical protein
LESPFPKTVTMVTSRLATLVESGVTSRSDWSRWPNNNWLAKVVKANPVND